MAVFCLVGAVTNVSVLIKGIHFWISVEILRESLMVPAQKWICLVRCFHSATLRRTVLNNWIKFERQRWHWIFPGDSCMARWSESAWDFLPDLTLQKRWLKPTELPLDEVIRYVTALLAILKDVFVDAPLLQILLRVFLDEMVVELAVVGRVDVSAAKLAGIDTTIEA